MLVDNIGVRGRYGVVIFLLEDFILKHGLVSLYLGGNNI
jgi:hypothetical protein